MPSLFLSVFAVFSLGRVFLLTADTTRTVTIPSANTKASAMIKSRTELVSTGVAIFCDKMDKKDKVL